MVFITFKGVWDWFSFAVQVTGSRGFPVTWLNAAKFSKKILPLIPSLLTAGVFSKGHLGARA